MTDNVRAELAPTYSPVVAGRPVRVTVRVHNEDESIQTLGLGLQGRLARWATIEPARLRLFPGEQGEAAVTFDLPRTRETPHGPVPYALTVSSWDGGDLATVAFGTLDIDTPAFPVLEINPRAAAGRFEVTYRLDVYNPADEPLEAHLVPSDPGGKLRFDSSALMIQVQPGAWARHSLQVRPRRTRWWGRADEYTFSVLLQPRDGEALRAEAVLCQLPALPFFRRGTREP